MSNNNASNNLIIAQRAVKQLRLEASIRRIKVSQAAAELRNFYHQSPAPCSEKETYEGFLRFYVFLWIHQLFLG
ncbi:guanine nucleotide-binding protein G(I)/G(S)/G(O) subunit gamma-10-like [Solea senegalensis]|uniref:Guanine nucleotide-binding protein G(I)/G(S)/G(O) subunit gamma-10-like n=1 Tax=Solea senegalensis TaxID=28829 RepID=A0AAV6Q9R9_SOLSE|nr:guanine nucleotide-binding protein G(I)/G(S)/G(O) subunit gamma-10-like [Solea senegalensis]